MSSFHIVEIWIVSNKQSRLNHYKKIKLFINIYVLYDCPSWLWLLTWNSLESPKKGVSTEGLSRSHCPVGISGSGLS